MLGSLATTGVLCWLTNARLVKKIARFNISQFYVIKINHRVQMIINIAEFITKEFIFRNLTIIPMSKYYRFHDKSFLGNHKCTASHYIIDNQYHCCIIFISLQFTH